MTLRKRSSDSIPPQFPSAKEGVESRLRQCVACRMLFPRIRMVRVTYSHTGLFSLDGVPPIEGRSAYCCQSVECLNEAIRARKFQRTLKRGIPDDIVERLKARLKGLSLL